MPYSSLLKLAQSFFKFAQSLSTKEIAKTISSLKTFVERLRYCASNFKKLGVGSSRIVYLLPDGKVIKLARSAKGVAQNATESDYGLQSSITNMVIDADPNDLWIITNLATKANAAFFQSQAGISFDEYKKILEYWWLEHHNKAQHKIKPENYDKIMDENEFIQHVTELIGNGNLMVGDFLKLNSYGNVNGKLVVIDFGTNEETYETFYKR